MLASITQTSKNTGSWVKRKGQGLTVALDEHRRAFLDHAVITDTEIPATQNPSDVGNNLAKYGGSLTQLRRVSTQISDAGM